MAEVETKLDKAKKITNPLTIIGMFAMLSETAVSVLATHVDKSILGAFLWFIMGFPVLLLVLFFLTLNFNRIALYAPGDFDDEKNFYNALSIKHNVVNKIDNVIEVSNKAKEELRKEITKKEAMSKNKFDQLINQKFRSIEGALRETKNSAEKIDINLNNTSRCKIESDIINYISNNPDSDMHSLCTNLKIAESHAALVLRRLSKRGVIISIHSDINNKRHITYKMNSGIIRIM